MNRILVASAHEPTLDPTALDEMFRFRAKVFQQRLGWDVQCEEGREIDRYDMLDPVYMLARSRSGAVAGCWRILPTTGPYMLRDTFPELLRGECAPCATDVWELSRFASESSGSGDLAQTCVSPVTFAMFHAMVAHADRHGIREYVTVTSVALERLLTRQGMPVERFGDGRAVRIGRVLSVACRLPINAQMRRAVAPDYL